jgi:hypothetical protein
MSRRRNDPARSPCDKYLFGLCHTAISADTTRWPHSFQWKSR